MRSLLCHKPMGKLVTCNITGWFVVCIEEISKDLERWGKYRKYSKTNKVFFQGAHPVND